MLMKMTGNIFVDVNALTFVRFEDLNQDATAVLKFKDGGKETMSGESVRNLHRHLAGSEQPVEQTEIEGEGEPRPSPSRTIKLDSVVVPTGISFLGRNKAWFYRKDENGRGLILAFVNAKGSCSLRTFDAERGKRLGKLYRTGNYQQQFADLIDGATELTVGRQPNLERDCQERIPEHLLIYLHKQIG